MSVEGRRKTQGACNSQYKPRPHIQRRPPSCALEKQPRPLPEGGCAPRVSCDVLRVWTRRNIDWPEPRYQPRYPITICAYIYARRRVALFAARRTMCACLLAHTQRRKTRRDSCSLEGPFCTDTASGWRAHCILPKLASTMACQHSTHRHTPRTSAQGREEGKRRAAKEKVGAEA